MRSPSFLPRPKKRHLHLTYRSTFMIFLLKQIDLRMLPPDFRHSVLLSWRETNPFHQFLPFQVRLSSQQLQGVLPGQVLLMFLVWKYLGQILVVIP